MTKVIDAGITFGDKEAAREILKHLDAPTTDKNLENLRIIIEELGEMMAESYNTMLVGAANDKLASYQCKCECGRALQIVVTGGDIFEGSHKV